MRYNGGMSAHHRAPSPETRTHLARLDAALEALAHGVARVLSDAGPAPTSLDPRTDAGLSVPSGERRLSARADAAVTYGRSA